MMIMLAIGFLLVGQDTDLILRERPTPTAYGGAASMMCERLEVSVEWKNIKDKGLITLSGQAIFARKAKSLEGELSIIKNQSSYVYDVEQSCEDLNKVLTIIKAADKNGILISWEMTVQDNYVVSIKGPFVEN